MGLVVKGAVCLEVCLEVCLVDSQVVAFLVLVVMPVPVPMPDLKLKRSINWLLLLTVALTTDVNISLLVVNRENVVLGPCPSSPAMRCLVAPHDLFIKNTIVS